MDKVPLPFITCCILHNICIDILDDVGVDPEYDEPDELLPLLGHENSGGSRLRNKIIRRLFSVTVAYVMNHFVNIAHL